MKALLQRVQTASVQVAGHEIARIHQGLLVFLALEKGDSPEAEAKMQDKILQLRIFSDDADRMNLNVQDIGGEILLVSQFTLAADCRRGRRPSFDRALPPDLARPAFAAFAQRLVARYPRVQLGEFGADMKVSLVNDGPVTLWLEF